MRIGMILSTPIPPQEGIGFYVWNLSNQLKQRGHDVLIITRGSSTEKAYEEINGISIFRPAFFPLYPFHVNLHGRFIDQLLERIGGSIDLLHLHTPLIKAPNTKKPIVVTVHTSIKTEIRDVSLNSPIGLLSKLQAPFSFRIEKKLFKKADVLTAVATDVAKGMGKYNVNPQHITVLGNGVDTAIFYTNDASQKKRFSNPNPYALAVIRLVKEKGLFDLIDCAKIVVQQQPNFRFLIVGTGPLERDLHNQIKEKNLDKNVLLLGHIENRTRLIELYRNATLFVHPAQVGKELPTVLLEAMACSCPTVVTSINGVLDVIHHRQNGLLVTPKIPFEMAGGILELLRNPVQAKSLGQAAASTVQESYAWRIIAESYLAEYGKFIKQQNMLMDGSAPQEAGALV